METFNDKVHEIAKEVADLVISKQRDYGTKNILNSPFGAEQGIITRLYDKVSRLINLISNKQNPSNESIEDTWKDVIGYSLVALMISRGCFELPLKDEGNNS